MCACRRLHLTSSELDVLNITMRIEVLRAPSLHRHQFLKAHLASALSRCMTHTEWGSGNPSASCCLGSVLSRSARVM